MMMMVMVMVRLLSLLVLFFAMLVTSIASADEEVPPPSMQKPQIHIKVGEPIENAIVTVDGEVLGKEEWAAVTVEPGSQHRIVVSRPGRAEWSATVDVKTTDEEVIVPADEPAPFAATTITPSIYRDHPQLLPRRPPSNRRAAGYFIGGVALVAIGTAIVTGALILDAKGTADDHCPTGGTCDASGRSAVNRMQGLLVVNAFAWVVGILATGSSAWLLFTPPPARRY
jgi:hypothetical protein